jgi:4-hydroxyphenylacetate 3-monooxygenase/4-hydroxybutyryl-CoA dehydratase/vinylacetyl-CoA-Delta-isomerase
LRTGKEYIEKMQKMRGNLYMDGQKVPRDHEAFIPALEKMALTFDLAADPDWEPLLTATSHVTGKKINRFCHIHQNPDDLIKRRELTRKFQLYAGSCIQRCGGADTINALSIVGYEVDRKNGTDYNQRFLKYLEDFQDHDLVAPIAMTDTKGDRSKRPHQQANPDVYLRLVEKRSDGIVVRGAKNCISGAGYADELIVSPSRALSKEESQWAVAFAVPADWEGVKMSCTPKPEGYKRKLMPALYAQYGGSDSFVIFDNVFIPWERVFMCGEVEFAPRYGQLAAIFHRLNYTACKPAMVEIFIGAAALMAEYNGLEKSEHIREKLGHLVAVAVLIDAAGIAASMQAKKTPSGTWIPGGLPTQAGRWLAGVSGYKEYEILTDIAGGIAALLPLEGDFFNPEIGPELHEFIQRRADVPAEHVHKLLRFIQDAINGPASGIHLAGSLHGGGSPIMQVIGLLREYDVEEKKNIVKMLCGIPVPNAKTRQPGPQTF